MISDKQRDKDCKCAPGMIKEDGKCVMPQVSFTSFFMALNTSAFYHLGEIADPVSGKTHKDPLMAKHTIDTMTMLQEKTKGNVNAEEAELIENSIYDLKMRYVKLTSESEK